MNKVVHQASFLALFSVVCDLNAFGTIIRENRTVMHLAASNLGARFPMLELVNLTSARWLPFVSE